MTHSNTVASLTIDVFADVVCPWCYIGERRLHRALGLRPAVPVVRRWRPFQLRPDMPAEGISWPDFVESRFGGLERARPLFAHVSAVGASVGLKFDFERIANSPNTLAAHRLILLAAEDGDEWTLVDRLFRAHFEEGLDVGDTETLVELARSVGLRPTEVRHYLASGQNRAAVVESQRAARSLGITGVPFFVLDNRYGVAGAQAEEILTRAIDRAVHENRSVGS